MRKNFIDIMRGIRTKVLKQADMSKNYEDAVRALNTLQSNASVLGKAKLQRDRLRHCNISDTINFCQRAGITLNDIDKLSIIHVSGTKGKGSTCAFCEAILREHGYKTGFFSSPHLIEVRERIRLNGRPLTKDAFSAYFWDCYSKLEETKNDHNGAMPAYFRFLTIMAFHVFLKEKVDVAIIEVGVGGEYDCTNIIRSPIVCGITSLGYDHISILGDTIGKIAWQKSGIIKNGYPVITIPQPENGLDVIAERAKEKSSQIMLAPSLESYGWGGKTPELGLVGKIQQINASLAIQLSSTWLKLNKLSPNDRKKVVAYDDNHNFTGSDIQPAEPIVISDPIYNGLTRCRWAGRNQIIKQDFVTFYIDGAHTKRSMMQCVEWFNYVANKEKSLIPGRVGRVLVFNSTGDRKPEDVLQHLLGCGFDGAAFCPNVATLSSVCAGIEISAKTVNSHLDQTNYNTTPDSQESRCATNRNTWLALMSSAEHGDGGGGDGGDNARDLGRVEGRTVIKPSVEEVFLSITNGNQSNTPSPADDGLSNVIASCDHVQVLITGSLHLVGCALRLLDPLMNDRDS